MRPPDSLVMHWKRQDSLEGCAERLCSAITTLGKLGPLMSSWATVEGARTRIVASDMDAIRTLLLEGQNRRDSDGSVIRELGYQVYLWNGEEGHRGVDISVHCGCATGQVGNRLTVGFGRSALDHASDGRWVTAVGELALIWLPEWGSVFALPATVTSGADRQRKAEDPIPGWIMYFGRSRFVMPTRAVVNAEVTSVGEIGWIVEAQKGPVDIDDPDQYGRQTDVARAWGVR